jgi:pyruvate dehydrogenase E2 component (dihydrolipoamide acetyltransferase)
MTYEFKFPDVGEGITEGEIVKWHVKEGDKVKQDQVLLEMETDKAVVEIPSPKSGTIVKIHHKEGDTVKVGEVLVTIDEVAEKATKARAEVESKKETKKEKPAPPPAVSERYTASVVGQLEEAPPGEIMREEVKEEIRPKTIEEAHALATPAVRRLARDLHVNLSKLTGTGHEGRITEEDIRKAAAQKGITEIQPAVHISKKYDFYGYVDRMPLRGVRKATAEHVAKSMRTAVHVTHMDEVDVTELVALREKEKVAADKKKIHLTYLPFIVKAVVAALKEHPMLNASLDDEHQEIIMKKYYNIGIAVDTQDGLMVPVIKNADHKSILDLAKEIEDLAQKAQLRKLDLADLKGSSFTITNIGVIGGLYATPVINWPDVAIMGTGRIYDKVVYHDEKIIVRKHMPFSVTFDHRVIDGAEVARFANAFKQQLEDPEMLLMGE